MSFVCEFVGFFPFFSVILFSCVWTEGEVRGVGDNEILVRKIGAGTG